MNKNIPITLIIIIIILAIFARFNSFAHRISTIIFHINSKSMPPVRSFLLTAKRLSNKLRIS